MFKVKIYTKLYVFGVKRLFGFHFFPSSSSPQGMVPGPSAGVCLCACTRLSVCVCVCAHTHAYTHRQTCLCACTCLSVCVCVCVCTLGHEAVPQVYVHFSPALSVPSVFSLIQVETLLSFGSFSFRSRKSLREGKKKRTIPNNLRGHPS